MQKSNFNLVSLVVIVVLMGALSFSLFPVVMGVRLRSEATAVSFKGKEIHAAITRANKEREALGLGSVWPRDNPPLTNSAERVDICDMNFTNSTDYFWELYDGDNLGTKEHSPYITDFDFCMLAGGGVVPHTGSGPLQSENNMWAIACNVWDCTDDTIPVLVTRNLAAESLPAETLDYFTYTRRTYFDDYWKTPFGEKLVVLVFQDGDMRIVRPKYLTHGVVYIQRGHLDFAEMPPYPLGYLTPNNKVVPSDAVYMACASSGDNPKKTASYYNRRYHISHICRMLNCFFIGVLLSGVYILHRAVNSRKRQIRLGVMPNAFWVILWLAISFYICMGVVFSYDYCYFYEYSMAGICISLVPALIFQIWGCVYLVLWTRSNHDLDAYRTAFKAMIRVPVTAFVVGVVVGFCFDDFLFCII